MSPRDRQVGLREAVEDVLTTLERVVTDSESQHPGGWGPDVTTVADLRDCQAVLRAALAAQVPAQEERLDVERLARAWWHCVNEPEEGSWEHASDADVHNAKAWAIEIAAEYRTLGDESKEEA